MRFDKLVISIQNTHDGLQRSAIKAVNQSLTVRNWLIGFYIVEFEQKGDDRAKYGDHLLQELAASIKIRGLSKTNLKLCRQFYIAYPHFFVSVKTTLVHLGLEITGIGQSLTDQLEQGQYHAFKADGNQVKATEKILSKLSFTHIVQLLPIKDIEKRTFYELECIQQGWSISELKRQINSLYYERSGISRKPEQLAKNVQQKAERLSAEDIIKSPFTFEFLGLQAKDVIYENDLEKALLEHIEIFLLEMGHGFCFEAPDWGRIFLYRPGFLPSHTKMPRPCRT